ncbi:Uncharacterised protein [Streptococcus pneumoniae]|uniref:Uncharacterized protein n=1 Tax=Streptococcus oralis subsp. oralis TaxID=1891914 RepID=A0A1X1HYZ6_STROR|nr:MULTISPECIES: hypothetical protein [Streptococcus]MCY7087417.1 hypothetical protein [Streptococcus oralis]MDS8823992.1 hypothetical protein [Streptococcus pneumoniae]MDS9021795.1 hypothetical protein [Streptococcus pneumoniae]ORO66096.1 hypothetical protein B7715_06890 [Streptococcus oralis subsp. oralis]CJS05667.1 Uncharacterised protein [Streptococcus pneumoniae]
MKLKHICEVCGCEEVLDSDEAFELGWDYPPRSCSFGMVAARTCPKCPIDKTLWWALAMEGKPLENLSKRQIEVLIRINNEPLSILPNSDDGLSD